MSLYGLPCCQSQVLLQKHLDALTGADVENLSDAQFQKEMDKHEGILSFEANPCSSPGCGTRDGHPKLLILPLGVIQVLVFPNLSSFQTIGSNQG